MINQRKGKGVKIKAKKKENDLHDFHHIALAQRGKQNYYYCTTKIVFTFLVYKIGIKNISFLFIFRSPKRSSSPPPVQPKAPPVKEKEYYKDEKKDKEKDDKRDKKEEKKTKKDKRDHKDKDKHKDRDKEKEHKEYKNKEIKSVKDVSNLKTKDSSPIVAPPTSSQVVNKVRGFFDKLK